MNCPSEKKFNWTLFKLKWTVACSWCRVGYGSCLGCHVLQCALCYIVRIALGPYARRTVVRQNSAHTMSHNNWSLQVQHALSRPKCNAPKKCGIKFNVCSVEYSCLIVMLLGNQLSKALYLIRNKSLHYKLALQHIAAAHNVTTKVSECALDAAWLSEHGALGYWVFK